MSKNNDKTSDPPLDPTASASSSSSSAASSMMPPAPPSSPRDSSDDDDDDATDNDDEEENNDEAKDEEEEEEGGGDDVVIEIGDSSDSDIDSAPNKAVKPKAKPSLVKPEPTSDDGASFTAANSVPSTAAAASAASGWKECPFCQLQLSSTALFDEHQSKCDLKDKKRSGDDSSSEDDDDGTTLAELAADKHHYNVATTRDNPFEFVVIYVNSLIADTNRQIRILSDDLRRAELENNILQKATEEARHSLDAYTSPTLREEKREYEEALKAQKKAQRDVAFFENDRLDVYGDKVSAVQEQEEIARQKRISTAYGRLAAAELDAANAATIHWNKQVTGRENKIEERTTFVKRSTETQTLARRICAKAHKKDGEADVAYLAEFQALTNTLGKMLQKAALVQLEQASKSSSASPSSADYNFRPVSAFNTMLTFSPNVKRFLGEYDRANVISEDDMATSKLTANNTAHVAAQTPLYQTVLSLAETDNEFKEWLKQSIYGMFHLYRLQYIVRPSPTGQAANIKVPDVWADHDRRLSALEYFLRLYLDKYANNNLRVWKYDVYEAREKTAIDEETRRKLTLARFFDYFHVGTGTVSLTFKNTATALNSVVMNLEYRHGGKLLLKAAEERQAVAKNEKRERVQLHKQKEQKQKKEERQTKNEERKQRDDDEKRAKAEKDAHPLRCPLVRSAASSSSSSASASAALSSGVPPILTPSVSSALYDELIRFAVNVPGRSIEPKAPSDGELHFVDRGTHFKSLSTKSSSIFMYDANRVRVLPASLKGYTILCAIYHFMPEKADYFLGVCVATANGTKKTLWFSPTPPNEDGECPENSAESLHFRAVYNDKKKKTAASSSSSSSAAAPSTSVAAGGDVLVSGKPLSLSVISTTTQSTSTTTTTTTAQIVLPTPVPVVAKRPLAGQQTATDPEVQPSKRPRVDPARPIESIIIID